MKIFSPDDIRKYFYASCFLAIFCLVLAIIAIGESGMGNLIEEKFAGQGQFDHASYSEHASDRAMSTGSMSYEMKRDWQNESDQTFSTSFIVSGAGGSYKDQYVVKASGAGYKHEYSATKISGDFSGSGKSTISMETGVQSLNSLVLMDGNATFRGRIINGQTGRPLTETEMDAVGEYVLRSYLNISEPIKTPEDWLGFCASFSDSLPASIGPAKLVPINGTA
jgi:hypothetical protein